MSRNISVIVVADSINANGVRLFTILAKYPRFIHAELMTHRGLSKNTSSSRAIPVEKMLAEIVRNPAMPEFWGLNQSGMQAKGEVRGVARWLAKKLWRTARWPAVAASWLMHKVGIHKQLANRLVEPWQHVTVLISGTDRCWHHFFGLRAHPDAQPTFQVLAYRILDRYLGHTPNIVKPGGYHMPFGDYLPDDVPDRMKLKIATGRSARLSYLTHDGERSAAKDIGLHERLIAADPAHASPFEHCAMSVPFVRPGLRSNFDVGYGADSSGWLQYRKTFENEFRGEANLGAILNRKPWWIEL